MPIQVGVDPKWIAELCERHPIVKMSLFGSLIWDDFTPTSDVDVIVEFKPNTIVGLRFITIADELSELFGRRVDLHTPNSLSKNIREEVLREAQPISVAA